MKKTFTKRLLSLVLTLCMILALLPAHTFALSEYSLQETDPIPALGAGDEVSFGIGLFKGEEQLSIGDIQGLMLENSDASVADVTLVHTGEGNGSEMDFAAYAASSSKKKPKEATVAEDGFAINKDLTTASVYKRPDNYFGWKDDSLYVLISSVGAVLAIDIAVPESGYYALGAQGLGTNVGATCELTVDETLMGVYSFYKTGNDTVVLPERQLGAVYLEKGTATVLIKKTADKASLNLTKLRLIPIGETADVKILAKKVGRTTVTISGTVDGNPVEVTYNLRVKGEPGIRVNVENKELLDVPFEGEPLELEVTFTVDGIPSTEKDFISMSSKIIDPLLVENSELRFEKGKIYLDVTLKAAGSTNAVVVVEHEEYGVQELVIPINVSGRGYQYNILKLHTGPGSNVGLDPDDVTDWSQTTVGSPNEIGRGRYSDPWIYIGPRPSELLMWGWVEYGIAFKPTAVGPSAIFGIDVPATGSYGVSMDSLVISSGGMFQVYIAPLEEEDPYQTKYKVGAPIDSYSYTQVNCQNLPVGNVYLEKGKYQYVLETVGKNDRSTSYIYGLGCIHLDSPKGREFTFTADREKVMIGREETIELTSRFNGAPFSAELVEDVVLTNANGEILEADWRADGENLALDVKGLALGFANVTLTAKYNGVETMESSFVFEVVAEDELEFATLTAPVSYADADEEIQLTASATQFDGTVVYQDDENVTFEYISSNTKVVAVDENGLMKTKGMGTADITVFITRGGITKTAKLEFTVTSDYPLVAAELTGLAGVAIGSEVQYRVSGRLANGAPIPDSAKIVFSIVENNDNAIELTEDGLVKGIGEGTATIKATVTTVANFSMDTNEFTITVYEGDGSGNVASEVLINMPKHYEDRNPQPKDIKIETAGWQVNKELTSPEIMSLDSTAFRWQVYGLNVRLADNLLVLDVNIPGDGYYQVEVSGGQYAYGPFAQFAMNGVYLGEYDMNDPGSTPFGKPVTLNTVYLTAGVHQLYIWRGTHTAESRSDLYLGTVRFTPVDAMPTEGDVDLRATKTTLSMGENGWLLPGVQMSDGTVKRVGYTADRAQDAENVIKSITVSGNSIKLLNNWEYTAVTPGTSTVTMVAVIDGQSYTETLDITVDDDVVSSVEAVLANPDLHSGDISGIAVSAFFGSGREVDLEEATVTFASTDESVAKVVGGVLETYKAGDVQITVTVSLGSGSAFAVLPITVLAPATEAVKIKSPHAAINPDDEGYQLSVVGTSPDGDEIELPGAIVTWSTNDTDIIGLTDTGFLTPKKLGSATVKATVEYLGSIYYPELVIQVREGKTKATYYTEEKLAAAQENIKKHDWAKEIRNAAITEADEFLDLYAGNITDYIYSMIPTQEIPRGALATYRWDPNGYTCKFCNVDLRDEFSAYPWLSDPFNYPWKIQCPNCMRRFPSNDFDKFYRVGLDEHGNFSYEKALAEGSHLLTNDDFPEKDEHIDKNGNLVNEGIHGWAVDDSRGYKTGKTYQGEMIANMKTHFDLDVSQMEESWSFIGYYHHYGVWSQNYSGMLRRALRVTRDAYLYTQDPKYGRVGAILLDRIADVHPEMQIKAWFPLMFNSDSSTPRGKEVGCIWQGGLSLDFAKTYDAFYEMYDDPYVVNYLSNKAKQHNYGEDYYVPDYFSNDYRLDGFKDPDYVEPQKLKKANDKSTPALIRQNIEENLLLEIVNSIYNGNIFGNFGISQATAAMAAVVLDTMPHTEDLLDWLWIPSDDVITDVSSTTHGDGHVQGGNVIRKIVQTVSRDGTGNEGAPNYNNIWSAQLDSMIDAMVTYDGYEGVDLFENPKFRMMYRATFPKLLLRHHTASIGDSGSYHGDNLTQINTRIFNKTKDVEIGQLLYWQNGNKVDGMHGDIFEDSDDLQADVKKIIDTYGEYDFDKSRQQTAFGLTVLRGGTKIESIGRDFDNQRYAYIYYGQSAGHGQFCRLDLGLAAFGIDFAPDFGYPEAADGSYRANYRDKNTIIHNTVIVNDKRQDSSYASGFPLHFDDAGRVKIFDVTDPNAYKAYGTVAEEYRRSIVNVEVDDKNAYTVDFFRVKGGDSHVYVFHANSNTITDKENLDHLVRQSRGTYAGADVEIGGYEAGGGNNGYDFAYNVERAEYPGKEFMVDFRIDQYLAYAPGSDRYHLKMTQLNDFDISEVALAKIQPPQKGNNPKEVQKVLVRREGKNLDTLFTTVFEPYDTERYILSEESVPMKRIGGAWETEADAAKAVKITLKNGRVDYVVYATNNKVLYSVDDRFEFCGFAGVYTLENDAAEEPIYAYLNDGTKIGDTEGVAAYTGTVVDFQEEAVLSNYITVKFDGEYDPYNLVGKYINVNNDGTENASYEILGVEVLDGGDVKLDLGYISLIRGLVDELNADKGYTHNIARGQTFSIPLPTVEDDSPIVDKIGSQVIAVGDTLEIPLSATTKSGAPVTFKLGSDLRGASVIDGVFYFSPTQTQIGKNHAAIVAVNGSLETTVHFDIEVFAGASTGGGGGGGGGSDEPEVTYSTLGNNVYIDSNGNVLSAGPDKTPGTADDIANVKKNDEGKYYYVRDGKVYTAGADGYLGTADDKAAEDVVVPTEKFVDLTAHAWAKDAIYRLVDAGIIKGVADDKFAPSAQITRADFAILLVRAWDLTAEDAGEFADIADSDYFAKEVGIASALGIVNGVGEGKFAPKAPITREQMMVMLARTLEAVKAEVKEVEDDVLADFTDADMISDYAVEAVKSMVGQGFIQGANGKINPKGNATRAEVAVLLDRILNK